MLEVDCRCEQKPGESMKHRATAIICACFGLLISLPGQAVSTDEIVEQLKQGGLVVVMRHAESPRQEPTEEEAARRNFNLERQLSESGMYAATDMGLSWRSAGIHFSAIYTSPAFRAEQTARYAGYGTPQLMVELDSASAQTPSAIEWLHFQANRRVPLGNRLIITHAGNISAAFGDEGRGMMNGEALILQPGTEGYTVLGRIGINSWPKLLLTD